MRGGSRIVREDQGAVTGSPRIRSRIAGGRKRMRKGGIRIRAHLGEFPVSGGDFPAEELEAGAEELESGPIWGHSLYPAAISRRKN